MLGVAFGDIVGASFERNPHKSIVFPLFSGHSRFTDETVLAVAVADALVRGDDYGDSIRAWGRSYPDAGHSGSFIRWLIDDQVGDYGSWSNGAAVRVPAVGWAFDSEDDVLSEASKTALPTHGHAEGVRGAQAVALAVFLARTGATREGMRAALERRFGYDLSSRLEHIRPFYRFNDSCQGSVPQAIIAFLQSQSVESAVRLAVSLGGDATAQAAIAGAIAEAYYGGLPPEVEAAVRQRLDLATQTTLDAFYTKYVVPARSARHKQPV